MSALRKRPQIMRLTDAAADRVREIMADAAETVIGLRIGVRNGGCAGMTYTMEFATARSPGEDVIEEKGVSLIVDPKAVLFLLGTELDVKADKFSNGFVFRNPNETSACGCGESVAITPASPEAVSAAAP